MSRPCILVAGGGTGGHVYPAVAVAEARLEAMADVDLVFCGTARGVEARVVPARGWKLELLDVEPMKGGPARRAVRGVAGRRNGHASGLRASCALASRAPFSATIGGYASGPSHPRRSHAGRSRMTVMEPNSVVGLANRLVAPFTKRAYLAWQEAEAPFRAEARRQYGVPLRPGFAPRPYALPRADASLVMGGSQGAQALGERMPQAYARLSSVPGIEILHQAGRDRDDAVRAAYGSGATGRVTVAPFVDEVAREIANADLVVARAGASTLAEITAIGRAAILVPFPHAADDHRARNAEALARAGAAVCLRQDVADPSRLAAEIERLLLDDAARVAMADCSRAWRRQPRRPPTSPPTCSPWPGSRPSARARPAAPPTARGLPPGGLMFRGRVRRVHFVGIGGIGMSGLAEILRTMEFDVSGSDLRPNEITRRLETLGVRIQLEARGANVEGADVVVYSSAIDSKNPEIARARWPRDPHHPPRRDARGADADALRGHHRGLARQDDDHVARRDRAARNRPGSHGGRRQRGQPRSAPTRAWARATSSSPRPTRATARSSSSRPPSRWSRTSTPSTWTSTGRTSG